TGKLMHTFRGHKGEVTTVAVLKNGERVLSGGSDGQVIVWDLAAGKEHHRFAIPGEPSVFSLAFNSNDTMYAAGLGDHTIALFHANSAVPHLMLRGHTNPVRTVAFSPDGKTLLS